MRMDRGQIFSGVRGESQSCFPDKEAAMSQREDPANIMTAWRKSPQASKLLDILPQVLRWGRRDICIQSMTNTFLPDVYRAFLYFLCKYNLDISTFNSINNILDLHIVNLSNPVLLVILLKCNAKAISYGSKYLKTCLLQLYELS